MLLGVEAKMFHRPSRAELEGQLAVQRVLLSGMATNLGVPEPVLVALLPQPLANAVGPLAAPTVTVTWEGVVERYRDVAPRYWLTMLELALSRYEQLASTTRRNDHHRLTGLEILTGAPDATFEYRYIGRRGGRDGAVLAGDFGPDGRWRGQVYQLRTTPLPSNLNWFDLDDFLARVRQWEVDHGS